LFINNASVSFFHRTKFHCTAITLTFTSRLKEAVRARSAYHLVYFYTEMLSGPTCSNLVLIGGHRTTTAPRSQRHECVVGAFQLANLTKDGATRTLRPTCSKNLRLTIKTAPPPYAPSRILFFLPEKRNAFSWFASVFPNYSRKIAYTSHNVPPSILPDQPLAVSISC